MKSFLFFIFFCHHKISFCVHLFLWQGKELRKKITLCTSALGIFLLITSILMWFSLSANVVSEDRFGHSSYYGGMAFLSFAIILLGVMPNDVGFIRLLR